MRKLIIGLAALSAAISTTALAQSYEQQQRDYQDKQAQYQDQKAQYQDRKAEYQDQKREYHHAMRAWVRGQVMPREYWADRYAIADWRARHLVDPGEGYRWVRDDDGDLVRIAVGSGVIEEVIVDPDRR